MAMATDYADLVLELSKLAEASQCNIDSCRMNTLGREQVVMLKLSGNWNQIAKMEHSIEPWQERKKIRVLMVRTSLESYTKPLLPYSVQLVALDSPGIVYRISQFFSEHEIVPREIACDSYVSGQTSTKMFTLSMTLGIPTELHLASLRERFMIFCDDLNIDAILEPIRT
jgi:glycine cleavage system transcriptional repressor